MSELPEIISHLEHGHFVRAARFAAVQLHYGRPAVLRFAPGDSTSYGIIIIGRGADRFNEGWRDELPYHRVILENSFGRSTTWGGKKVGPSWAAYTLTAQRGEGSADRHTGAVMSAFLNAVVDAQAAM